MLLQHRQRGDEFRRVLRWQLHEIEGLLTRKPPPLQFVLQSIAGPGCTSRLLRGTALCVTNAYSLHSVVQHSACGDNTDHFARGGVISIAQMAMGRMYIPARKLPSTSHASGVRNQ